VNLDDLVRRADELLQEGQKVLASAQSGDFGAWVNNGLMAGYRSACLSFIEMVYGTSHSHYKHFEKIVTQSTPSDAEAALGIIRTISTELAGGWLVRTRQLVTAEVFADFLEMAEYLLSEDYKDAAAVIAGSALEEHLRQLCVSNGIEVTREVDGKPRPKKADLLNAELAKADVYNKLDQKAVTMWLDLRNKAAHGHYDDFTGEQVGTMLSGVTEFMARMT
jgi:hypothetical protein